MNEIVRKTLIQELNKLKIELDRGNKIKNESTKLTFEVSQSQNGQLEIFATTGASSKLVLEKPFEKRWRSSASNQFTTLGKWLVDLLNYESDLIRIVRSIELKIQNLYHY